MRIKEFLRVNHLKQKELASYLDVTEASVSRLVSGKSTKPSEVNLNKILTNPYGWDTSMLMEEDEPICRRSAPAEPEHSYDIPILPVFAHAGTLQDFSAPVQRRDCETGISPVHGDFIIPIHGESMEPEYPNGSRIVVKKANNVIEYGKTYVLDTKSDGVVVKKLYQSEKESEYKCVSVNPSYPEFTIKKDEVLGIYRVLMVMTMK